MTGHPRPAGPAARSALETDDPRQPGAAKWHAACQPGHPDSSCDELTATRARPFRDGPPSAGPVYPRAMRRPSGPAGPRPADPLPRGQGRPGARDAASSESGSGPRSSRSSSASSSWGSACSSRPEPRARAGRPRGAPSRDRPRPGRLHPDRRRERDARGPARHHPSPVLELRAQLPDVRRIDVYRRNGVEAFTDLETLEAVNVYAGLEPDLIQRITRLRREPGQRIDHPLFRRAVETGAAPGAHRGARREPAS